MPIAYDEFWFSLLHIMDILIVVDMQKDFVDGSLGSQEAQDMVQNLVQIIASHDGPIIATLDTHAEDYMETSEGRHLPVPHCIKGTDGWQLDYRIEKALKDRESDTKVLYLEKPTFGSVRLPDIIRGMAAGRDFSCTFTGLCTDICVISNALLLKAHFPEVPMKVLADCCAGVTPEKHEASLDVMASCQIEVVRGNRYV